MRRSSLVSAGAQRSSPFLKAGGADFIGGLCAFLGYAIVIWAMTRAPIAAVAALRETSVVFAAIIGVVALGEPFHSQRAIAVLVILAGIILLRIG